VNVLFKILTLVVFLSAVTWATGQDETVPCSSATTNAAMQSCESRRYAVEDHVLNAVYLNLMKKLDNVGRKKLRLSQTAWLRFRQSNSEFEADAARGGTLAGVVKITVLADMTRARVAELEKSMVRY
jgi:uncharacterized protein YecT (DUF1311 family)